MLRLKIKFILGGALLALLLVVAWWVVGGNATFDKHSVSPPSLARRASNPVWCGPSAIPKPPPPPEGVFGLLLYPNLAPARVTLLPVAKICDRLNDPADDPEADLSIIATLLRQYERATGAMPQGSLNSEITLRLQGRNPQGAALLPKTHRTVSRENELLDRWGTPYDFHALSARTMTIRSAGPDKKMWTSDDLVQEVD